MAGLDANVLVVEDEPDVADIYADWLGDDYAVDIAYSGQAALDALDPSVDVVLLDRRIPDIHGDDILEEINARELSCWVAIVTAVEPQFDILDMGFDDYLVKPVTAESLHATVARLLARDAYDAALRSYFAAVSKRAVLTDEYSRARLAEHPGFQQLEATIEQERADLDALISGLTRADFQAVLRDAVEERPGPDRDA